VALRLKIPGLTFGCCCCNCQDQICNLKRISLVEVADLILTVTAAAAERQAGNFEPESHADTLFGD
jgi:hypothetical protein